MQGGKEGGISTVERNGCKKIRGMQKLPGCDSNSNKVRDEKQSEGTEGCG